MASEMKEPEMRTEIVQKRKRKSLSELLDKWASQNVTTKKRSNLCRTRNLTSLPIDEQSCQKNKTSLSKPSTENVTSDKIQQKNDKVQDGPIGRVGRPMAYRSGRNLACMEENPIKKDALSSDPIFIERPFAKERKNPILKPVGQAYSKQTKRNVEDKSSASVKKTDQNEPPNLATAEEHCSSKSNLVNAGLTYKIATISHVTKNETITNTDIKGKCKEIEVVRDGDGNDDDVEKTVRLMNKAPATSFDLHKINDESCDSKHKGKEKMVEPHEEDSVSAMPLKALWKTMRIPIKKPKSEPKPEPQAVPKLMALVPCNNHISVTSRRLHPRPVWVNLIPSENGEGGASLPPLPNSYLSVRNADNVPISTLEEHIKKRLNLLDTEEVEIMLWGLLVHPTVRIGDLLDVWCQNPPINCEQVSVKIGSSGEEYVMTLRYARKA